MIVLADSNVGLRWLAERGPDDAIASEALHRLRDRGDCLVMTPQNFIEIWSVATRPRAVNGLGIAVARAGRMLARLERIFQLLPDSPLVFPIWRRLTLAHAVRGRQVHDARLAAAMMAHGVTSILTFNGADFARFPGLTVLDPGAVASDVCAGGGDGPG